MLSDLHEKMYHFWLLHGWGRGHRGGRSIPWDSGGALDAEDAVERESCTWTSRVFRRQSWQDLPIG